MSRNRTFALLWVVIATLGSAFAPRAVAEDRPEDGLGYSSFDVAAFQDAMVTEFRERYADIWSQDGSRWRVGVVSADPSDQDRARGAARDRGLDDGLIETVNATHSRSELEDYYERTLDLLMSHIDPSLGSITLSIDPSSNRLLIEVSSNSLLDGVRSELEAMVPTTALYVREVAGEWVSADSRDTLSPIQGWEARERYRCSSNR